MTDDRDLLPPVPLSETSVVAHLAVLTQAVNNVHQQVFASRLEAKDRDDKMSHQLVDLASELDKVKQTALTPTQHMWVVVGQQRSVARGQRWSSRLTSLEAAMFYLIVVVIGGAVLVPLLSSHHWIP